MHIPMQVDYGVRALVDLAIHEQEGSVRMADIADRQGIPPPYLAQLLNTLSKKGVISSRRGPTGGHSLAMNPSDITMGLIMTHLGNSSSLMTCFVDIDSCIQSSRCGQRTIWRRVEAAISKVLDSTTIADLIAVHMPTNLHGLPSVDQTDFETTGTGAR